MNATRYSSAMLRWGCVALIACAVIGCLREPVFRGAGPDDASGDGDASTDGGIEIPLVTAVRSGFDDRGATVTAPGYEVEFSDSGSFFPHLLNVGPAGARMAMMGTGRDCNDERASGVALFPPLAINGHPDSSASQSMLQIVLAGPVVAKVTLDWSATFDCSVTTTLGNRSTFTFFPDDRIIRRDRLQVGENVSPSGCAVCSGGANPAAFWLTSYMTLGAEGATPHNYTVGNVYNNEQAGRQVVCISRLQRQVAFAWPMAAGRVRRNNTTPSTLAFIYDFQNAATSLDTTTYEATTAMTVSATAICADVADRAEYHAIEATQLLINGSAFPPGHDGIYGGEPTGGDGGIDTQPGPIVITPQASGMRESFAVWIDFGVQSNTNVRIEHSVSKTGTWYRAQRVDAREIVFWFRDPLLSGQSITITPG